MQNLRIFVLAALLSFTTALMAQTIVTAGAWRVSVDDQGKALVEYNDKTILADNEAEWGLQEVRTAFSDLSSIQVEQNEISDDFGSGIALSISGISATDNTTKITHTYYIYSDRNYILTDLVVESANELEINYIAPVSTATPVNILGESDNWALFVPFDNDGWVRYRTTPFGSDHEMSISVTALLNKTSRQGIIVGGIDHDTWKIGIKPITSAGNTLSKLYAFGGANSTWTRDIGPHGAVKGQRVASPRIMVGCFDDWRTGLETYADLCATVAPPLHTQYAKPFGWNSWGVIQKDIKYSKAEEVAQYYADVLQPAGFHSADSIVFIGIDSYWDQGFNLRQHRRFNNDCEERRQHAGIYWCPWVDWSGNAGAAVSGTDYSYGDIYLYDVNGNIQKIAGGVALDPTHPGTQARMKAQFEDFLEWGYKYIKLDFMVHGALEGRHYDPNVTTGIQAYSQGMKYLAELIGDKMFVNLSIAPLFPANYAHSRRIACDAFANIDATEYTLNSLSFGWWLDRVYSYNDADHVVLDGGSKGENRARITSSVITGIVIIGDDFTAGSTTSRERAEEFLTNPHVNQIARDCKAFRPVEAAEEINAANMFVYHLADTTYLAHLNYEYSTARDEVDFARIGLIPGTQYTVHEVWSDKKEVYDNNFTSTLRRTDAAIYKIYPYDDSGVTNANATRKVDCYYDHADEAIRFTANATVAETKVYNIAGECVIANTDSHARLDVSNLPAGIYISRSTTADGNNITCKFVR